MAAEERDSHHDPLNEEPSSHPVGTGGGVAGGTVPGTAAGPLGMGSTAPQGAAAAVGEAQSAGDNSGDRDDVIDVLKDLVECCKDGEYGFQSCADHAQHEDLKTIFRQRAEDCQRGAQALQTQIRSLGAQVADSGSVMGAAHRGWVSARAALSTHNDQAMLDEAERGEDNALARYRKALQKSLPAGIRQLVEGQLEGVQRNHDQIRMLRNQHRAAGG